MTSALDTILEGGDWPSVFPDRLSPSSIATAAACPEKWRRRYVHHEREPWGGAAIVGIAVHRSAEHNFRAKIDTHEDLPIGEVMDVCANAFDERVQEAEHDGGIEWGDTKPGPAKDQSVQLAEAYHLIGAPRVQPVAVEEWCEAQLPGCPPVIGRVDVRTATVVPDIKTTGRKMTSPRGDWRLKGMLYSWMTGLGFEWHVVTKTRTPGVYHPGTDPGLAMPHSPLLVKLAARRVQTISSELTGLLERYGPDEPWPTNATEHEWMCDAKFCGFRHSCRWWVG